MKEILVFLDQENSRLLQKGKAKELVFFKNKKPISGQILALLLKVVGSERSSLYFFSN